MARSGAPRPADALLVLGCPPLANGGISPLLRSRMDAALELYRAGLAPVIILSGGKVNSPRVEAQVMWQYALSRGIPAAALLIEDGSRNTLENMTKTRRLADEYGIKSLLIVTTRHHTRRAALLARRFLQLPAQVIPAAYPSDFGLPARARLIRNEAYLVLKTLYLMVVDPERGLHD